MNPRSLIKCRAKKKKNSTQHWIPIMYVYLRFDKNSKKRWSYICYKCNILLRLIVNNDANTHRSMYLSELVDCWEEVRFIYYTLMINIPPLSIVQNFRSSSTIFMDWWYQLQLSAPYSDDGTLLCYSISYVCFLNVLDQIFKIETNL